MVVRISNKHESQTPVVLDDVPCPAARDEVVSRVGAVRYMKTATPWSVAARKYVRLSCSDLEESDDDVLSVGAVWPLTTAAPLGGAMMMVSDDDVLSVGAVRPLAYAAPVGGAGMMDDCQQRADAKDDVFSMGARGPMNRPRMCCARVDDFDWVVPHYDPETLLSRRDMEVGVTDISQDIRVCRTLSGHV